MFALRKIIFYLYFIALLATVLNAKSDLEKVSIQLKWFYQYQFAGVMVAKEKGFYEDVGLDVSIKERDPKKNNITQVVNGDSEYGVADSVILRYRAEGHPVKVIATIFQHNAMVLMSKKESGIVSPYEMKGKNISFQEGLDDSIISSLLAFAHLDQDDYVKKPMDFTHMNFVRGEIDISEAYISIEPYWLKKRHNIDVNIIDPKNYGIDFYGDLIFTTQKEIQEHPQRVKNFKEATLKGWEYALQNPDETIKIILEKYNTRALTYEQLLYEARITENLIATKFIPLGDVKKERFQILADLYQGRGLSKEKLDEAVTTLIYDPNKRENIFEKYVYWILSGGLFLFLLVLLLIFNNRRLNFLVREKTKKVALYADIIDKNVLSSVTDLDGRILEASEAFCILTGYTREEFLGKNHNILKHTDAKKSDYKPMWDSITDNKIWSGEVKNIKKDGSVYWVNATIFPLFDDENVKIGYMAIRQDITDKKAIEAQQLEILKSQEKLEKLFNHQRNIIVISDGKKLKMTNKAMLHFFGIEKVEEFTQFYSDISDKFMGINNYFSLDKVPQGANWIKILEPLMGDERIVAMHDSENIPHAFSVSISPFDEKDFIVSLTDISSTMIEKIHLSNKVTHDKLTGALNREFLDNNLPHIVNKIGESNHLGLAIVDIDFFKKVNDTYGHIVGDMILKEITKLVVSSIRNEDFFIRWGGEEFILLIECESIQTLTRALEHVRQRIEHSPFSDIGTITCSFGATLHLAEESIDTTIHRADIALYRAKQNGRNQVQVEFI